MPPMGMVQRAERRRKRIVAHQARSHDDEERWDPEFWQLQTPQDRVSALVAVRRGVDRGNRRQDDVRVLQRVRPLRERKNS